MVLLITPDIRTGGFDPDEPRDEHGRWSSGGDDAQTKTIVIPTKPHSVAYFNPAKRPKFMSNADVDARAEVLAKGEQDHKEHARIHNANGTITRIDGTYGSVPLPKGLDLTGAIYHKNHPTTEHSINKNELFLLLDAKSVFVHAANGSIYKAQLKPRVKALPKYPLFGKGFIPNVFRFDQHSVLDQASKIADKRMLDFAMAKRKGGVANYASMYLTAAENRAQLLHDAGVIKYDKVVSPHTYVADERKFINSWQRSNARYSAYLEIREVLKGVAVA